MQVWQIMIATPTSHDDMIMLVFISYIQQGSKILPTNFIGLN